MIPRKYKQLSIQGGGNKFYALYRRYCVDLFVTEPNNHYFLKLPKWEMNALKNTFDFVADMVHSVSAEINDTRHEIFSSNNSNDTEKI